MRFWGRIGVNSKEKFGTARIYVSFWDGSLHGLFYPGYMRSKFPQWLWSLDIMYISRFLRWTRFPKIVGWYQSKIYGMAYRKGIRKFPKVKIELVVDADYPEFIKDRKAIMRMYRFRYLVEKLIVNPATLEETDDDLLY